MDYEFYLNEAILKNYQNEKPLIMYNFIKNPQIQGHICHIEKPLTILLYRITPNLLK